LLRSREGFDFVPRDNGLGWGDWLAVKHIMESAFVFVIGLELIQFDRALLRMNEIVGLPKAVRFMIALEGNEVNRRRSVLNDGMGLWGIGIRELRQVSEHLQTCRKTSY
jgi:hypothetical protein